MSDVMMSDIFYANMVSYFHIPYTHRINFISTFIIFVNQVGPPAVLNLSGNPRQ